MAGVSPRRVLRWSIRIWHGADDYPPRCYLATAGVLPGSWPPFSLAEGAGDTVTSGL
jgi:hypothetical protein